MIVVHGNRTGRCAKFAERLLHEMNTRPQVFVSTQTPDEIVKAMRAEEFVDIRLKQTQVANIYRAIIKK